MKKFLLLFAVFATTAGSLSAAGLDPAAMMPNEWTEFRYERLALIRSNPKLAAEDRSLQAALDVHAAEVSEAMIQADPAVTPILAKVKKLLQSNWDGPKPGAVTVGEWKKLRTARQAALDANPALVAKGKALLKKKDALDAKVDAALAASDASLKPLINKFGAREAGEY